MSDLFAMRTERIPLLLSCKIPQVFGGCGKRLRAELGTGA